MVGDPRATEWLKKARKVIVAADVDKQVINVELRKARPDLLQTFDER